MSRSMLVYWSAHGKKLIKKERIESSKQILCGCPHGRTYYFMNPSATQK